MRALLRGSIAAAALTFALAGATALAAADPSVGQIYEAASSGRMDEAQRMMDQVLRDHPGSAKAHFVQAELYARQGKLALARSEFEQAQQLKPGLPDESPRAVQELAEQLRGRSVAGGEPLGVHHFPWGAALMLALVVAAFWLLFRRRPSYGQYPAATAAPGAYGPGGPGPYGPGAYPAGGGGIGSSIAGGLAGGLAAGAGIVAGEELAHHFLDGDRTPGGVIAPASAGDWEGAAPNADMGGANFGIKDPSSWDDGAGSGGDFGGGGDGGGDWS